jgi:hypothetical protein
VPDGGPRLSLEKVIQALHDSEINAGLQTFAYSGLRAWIGDERNGMRAAGDLDPGKAHQWAGDGAVALWFHRAALRLFPDSAYAKKRGRDARALTSG